MNRQYTFKEIPRSRIATFDVFSIGLTRHHVSALLEFDVTEVRKRLKVLRREGVLISFNGWLIKSISEVLEHHREASAFVYNKKSLIIFDDINISIIVEKTINNNRLPIPLVIERTNHKTANEITLEIEQAKGKALSADDITLNKPPDIYERIYYHLPGFMRRLIWKIMLSNPKFAYNKMGSVMITSLGMVGKINGWFIHKSIHPISFGVGSVIKKPVVIGADIKIREILNMTILVDHDIMDGAQMVRLLNELTTKIEQTTN